MHHERRNMNENNSNDLQTIITQVIEEMKSEQGDKHDKRMNDCLPPILFSAIFKLLKVLPDTELDAC